VSRWFDVPAVVLGTSGRATRNWSWTRLARPVRARLSLDPPANVVFW